MSMAVSAREATKAGAAPADGRAGFERGLCPGCWLAAIVGTLLTLAAYLVVRHLESERHDAMLSEHAAEVAAALDQRLERYLAAVEALGAFMVTAHPVTRGGFRRFVPPLLAHAAGISSLAWIPRVVHADRASFERSTPGDGFDGFEFTQRASQGVMVRREDAPEYFPVYYQAPLVEGGIALGFDVASNVLRRSALESARDSGQAVVTRRITLVEEKRNAFGFLLFQPVYQVTSRGDSIEGRRQALMGFARAVVSVPDLLGSVEPHVSAGKLQVTLIDANAQPGERLLGTTLKEATAARAEAELLAGLRAGRHKARPITFGGGRWELIATPGARFESAHYWSHAALALLCGALGTLLAISRLRAVGRRTHAIERVAALRTRELNASRDALLAQQAALSEITRGELLSQGELGPVFERITETAAATLNVERVSIWRYSADRSVLRCCDLYKLAPREHSNHMELKVGDFPTYFAALARGEIIDAADAHADSRTSEFSESYLTPLGIGAMLDIPVFLGGRLDGVICCEHVGAAREWSPEDRLFVTALANIIGVAEGHSERLRIAEELASNEATYRQAFIANPVPMWVRDRKTPGLLAVNDAAIAAYGYSREEFLAISSHDLRPPSDVAAHEQMMRDEDAQPHRTHTRLAQHRRKDGSVFDVQVTSHPFSFRGRRARLLLAVDVTERLRAEAALRESEATLRALLDGIPDQVWLKDAQCRYVALNRSAEEWLGLPQARVIGKTPHEVWPPEQAAVIAAEDALAIRSGEPLRIERRAVFGSRWHEVTRIPVKGHAPASGVISVIRDITERKRGEGERRARELEQRRTLVREIHHRIKNHIQGVAGLLLGHARRRPALAPDIRAAVAQLHAVAVVHGLQGAGDQGTHLDRMVGAIFEAARGYAGARITLQLRGETAAVVDGDEAVPIALVVNELLTNAVKHASARHGIHAVEVRMTHTDGRVQISILNPGRLARHGDGRSDAAGGHGLSIVRSLLPPQGAAFSIAQCGESVCAALDLEPPVVRPAKETAEQGQKSRQAETAP